MSHAAWHSPGHTPWPHARRSTSANCGTSPWWPPRPRRPLACVLAGRRRARGHPVRIGAVTEQPDDWLTAIANGYGIALAPESAARFYTRPGVVYRPVTGVAPSRVGVAWAPADDADPVVQDFVRCCREVCAGT
ncbi:hypothetical protein STENM327S_01288 [Streptomyces tendae]